MLPAACLIATGYVNGSVSLAVGLITAAIALSGVSYACWAVNQLDLAPQYAGEWLKIDAARIVFAAGSMQRSGVRPSVSPSG